MENCLKKLLGIGECNILDVEDRPTQLEVFIIPNVTPRTKAGETLIKFGSRWRSVRTVNIGSKQVMLKVEVIRWKNTTTGENFEQAPNFVRPYERMTRHRT